MFELPDLPYPYDALQPAISDRTMHVHHDKHHAKYVDTLNGLLKDAAPKSMEAVISEAEGKAPKVFNNAAQSWNHAFFWLSMTPKAGAPAGDLASAIEKGFGGLDKLKAAFVEEGVGHFASGWVWLAAEGETLKVVSTHDAATLAADGKLTPLLVCDLWEHAYYLDHQQDRKGFLEAWFDSLADWSFAAKQYAAARGDGQAWRYPAPKSA